MNENCQQDATSGRDARGEEEESSAPLPHQKLEDYLDEVARAHGYVSYSDMHRRIAANSELLDKERRSRLLRKLLPVSGVTASTTELPPLPATDVTGLAPEPDLVKSLARLIRVLLVGYTEDEVRELRDRVNAMRAQDVEATAHERDERHDRVMERLDHIARSPRVAP